VRICSIRQYRLPVKPCSGRNGLARQAVLFASIYGTAEFFHPTVEDVDKIFLKRGYPLSRSRITAMR
jgi:hypothetical protein